MDASDVVNDVPSNAWNQLPFDTFWRVYKQTHTTPYHSSPHRIPHSHSDSSRFQINYRKVYKIYIFIIAIISHTFTFWTNNKTAAKWCDDGNGWMHAVRCGGEHERGGGARSQRPYAEYGTVFILLGLGKLSHHYTYALQILYTTPSLY